MKKILLIIISFIIATSLLPYTTSLADDEILGELMQSDGQDGTNDGYIVDAQWGAQIFQANSSFILSGISLKSTKQGTPTSDWGIQLGEANQSTKKPGSTASVTWSYDPDNFDGDPTWYHYGGKSLQLIKDTYYFIVVYPKTGEASSTNAGAWCNAGNGTGSYSWDSDDEGVSWDERDQMWTFRLYGFTAQVQTRNPTYSQTPLNSVFLNGFVKSFGEDTELDVSFQWGTDNSTWANETGTITVTEIGAYQKKIFNLIPDAVYYVRAKAYGSGSGTVYGESISFTLASSSLFNIETLQPYNIKFTTFSSGAEILNMSDFESANLTLDVGTTSDYSLGEYSIQEEATVEGVYPISLSGLTAGTRYHLRAKAVSDNTTVYGDDKTVLMHDPDKADWVNNVNDWWEENGYNSESAWWLVLGALILITMTFCLFYGVSWKVGIALSGLYTALFIALKLIDYWLVIILGIIIALAITGVIKRRGDN